jgi:DNA repair exonuclease SbcCD ATPase subunit
MLMRMARENMRGELPVMLEAVSAAVQALGEGKIALEEISPKTRKDAIRYAPSFVSGGACVTPGVTHAYTAENLAKFLGSVYYKKASGTAQNSVVAALAILEAEELKLEGFDLSNLRKEERIVPRVEGIAYNPAEKEETKYKPVKEIIKFLADVKRTHIVVQERRGKTLAELSELREKQLAAQKKAKEDAKKAEEDHKALVQKLADAERDENNRKADALAAKLKESDIRAKDKEALNKTRMKELEAQLAEKKSWESEQRIQDEYAPIRRDVEAMISKFEMMVSERNPLREAVKSLASNKKVKPQDLVRLRTAAVAIADWFNDWVAPQFAPELKAAQKVAVDKHKATKTRTEGSGA